jgi:hypothetical protein
MHFLSALRARAIVRGVIMIFKTSFAKVMQFSINFGRQVLDFIARKYNAGNAVLARNSHLVTPASSSIYGVLMSGETARHWL